MPETQAKQVDLKIGLGEAIQRLISVDRRYTHMHTQTPQDLLDERDMIIAALNQFQLDLNMSCEIKSEEAVPENVHIFEHTVRTSCCRIENASDSSRRQEVEKPVPPEPQRSAMSRIFDPILGIWKSPAKG